MKRLIICADGTWDTPDIIDTDKQSVRLERLQSSSPDQEQKILYNRPIREPTNVVKMARAIVPTAKDKTPQVVYYDTDIGTGMGFYDKFIGGGFGVGLSKNILREAATVILCPKKKLNEIRINFGIVSTALLGEYQASEQGTSITLKPLDKQDTH